jgi:hypothetical protein
LIGRRAGVKNRLNDASAIPQVEEHQVAMITIAIDPTIERNFLPDMIRAESAASVSAFPVCHRREPPLFLV